MGGVVTCQQNTLLRQILSKSCEQCMCINSSNALPQKAETK